MVYDEHSSFGAVKECWSINWVTFTTQDFNRPMQLRPFYFDIQINVSPGFAAQKTLASHVEQIISQCHSIQSFCNFASREISFSSLRRIKNS